MANDEKGKAGWARGHRRPIAVRAALAAVMAASIGGLASSYNDSYRADSGLRDILTEARWIKPRLSVDGPVLVCPPAADRSILTSCPTQTPSVELLRRLSSLSHHVSQGSRFALAALLQGRSTEPLLPTDARTVAEQVDAAAVQLVLGERFREPERYGSALVLAGRAAESDPNNVRALFNYALASEKLYLDELAKATWRRYAELETEEVWLREARQHLEALSQPSVIERWRAEKSIAGVRDESSGQQLVETFASEVREQFLRHDLRLWAERGEPFACQELETWSILGRAYQQVTSDVMIRKTVTWLGKTFCEDTDGHVEAAAALRELQSGLLHHERLENAASFEILERTGVSLRELRSPLHFNAELAAAIDLFGMNQYAAAAARLEELEAKALQEGMLFVGARAAWMRGTIALREQDLPGALKHYQRARQAFDRGRFRPYSAGVRGVIAETLGRMGSTQEAWRTALDGLRIAREHGLPHRLYAVCSLAGTLARLERNDALAEPFQTCALHFVRQLDAPEMAYDAHMWRAVSRYHLGRRSGAFSDLEASQRNASEIADQQERIRAEASIDLVKGALLLETEPEKAERYLSRAIAFFDSSQHHYYASDARQLRATIELRSGRLDAAEADLHHVLFLHERFRMTSDDVESRLEVLANDRSIYSRLTELELDYRQDVWRALYFADRGKRDHYQEPEKGTPTWNPGQVDDTVRRWRSALAKLPNQVTIVNYHLMGETLVTWVLRAEEPSMDRWAIQSTEQYVGVSEDVAEEPWASALAKPLYGSIEPEGLLVVVPDAKLNGFPFATLSYGGEPLVKTAAVVIATSLDDFLAAAPAGRSEESLDKLTALVAPESPLARQAGLGQLPVNEDEIEVLGGSFKAPEMVLGTQATASRLLNSLANPGVLHVSSHASLDTRRPLNSALWLSPDDLHQDGRVSALDLYGATPPAASLVVLAACNTASAPRTLPLSLTLVRPFLQGGVPAVVGSLTAVRDDLFVRFIQRFYSKLDHGATVVEAARSAQLDLLGASAPGDTNWAQIELFITHRALDLRRRHGRHDGI